MELLSIPFRIGDDGRPERIWQGSEAHAHQQALQFVSTKPGELPMSPLYGIDHPSFRSIDAAEVVVGMATFVWFLVITFAAARAFPGDPAPR